MKAKIVDRKWVVEWFDERQCYHMPSLTLADNGNLLAVWNGGEPVAAVVHGGKPGRREDLDEAGAERDPQ